MRIDEFQDELTEWTFDNFPDTSLPTAALGTSEEIGELAEAVLGLVAAYGNVARAIVKGDQEIRGDADRWMALLPKELADCFIKVCDVAIRSGVDLDSAVTQRWAKVKERVAGSAEEAKRGPGLSLVEE